MENKQLIRKLAKDEKTLWDAISFDFGIFIFAMFQLAITNFIIFKGVSKFHKTNLIIVLECP